MKALAHVGIMLFLIGVLGVYFGFSHKITSTLARAEIATTTIGGNWITPTQGATVSRVVYVAMSTTHGNTIWPPIAFVRFTLSWPGRVDPDHPGWIRACEEWQPTRGNRYGCDIDLSAYNVPIGQVDISIDVYNTFGWVNKAPNGVRHLKYVGGSRI